MRQIRRKQFYAFFEGFFDKHTNDSLKLKTMKIEFSEQDKKDLLAKYFKQYFTEKLDIEKTDKEQEIGEEYKVHDKLNKAVPPFVGNLNYIAENHKDAFLGKSKGILGAYGTQQQQEDLMSAIQERQSKKMRPAKLLIQS